MGMPLASTSFLLTKHLYPVTFNYILPCSQQMFSPKLRNRWHNRTRVQEWASQSSSIMQKIHLIVSKTAMNSWSILKCSSMKIKKLNIQSKCSAYPFGPASPSPRTRRVLPLLTPGGIFTLISFLTRIRPSPEHFLQYSEMTSPSPAQVGQIETYKIKINK
jgi:hypothetical protein